MNTLILDCGNAIIKGKVPQGTTSAPTGEVEYPHAVVELSPADYDHVMMRTSATGAGPDFIRVNGKPYAIGESAEGYGETTPLRGAARYTPAYYGVFVAATLARLYSTGGDVRLFGSHAPGDIEYRDDLSDAALGTYHVEIGGAERHYRVVSVNTFDEPLGGLMNVMLTQDGVNYQRTDINGGYALVLDIGGLTVDLLAVAPGGKVDYSINESVPIGIGQAVKRFETSLRQTYRDVVKSAKTLRPDRVREAMSTGVFKGGGKELPCENEAREATTALLNQIGRVYHDIAGGPANWDTVILTGGGSVMLYDRLLPLLDHGRVILAEDEHAAHLANVRGGLKLRRLYDHLGVG